MLLLLLLLVPASSGGMEVGGGIPPAAGGEWEEGEEFHQQRGGMGWEEESPPAASSGRGWKERISTSSLSGGWGGKNLHQQLFRRRNGSGRVESPPAAFPEEDGVGEESPWPPLCPHLPLKSVPLTSYKDRRWSWKRCRCPSTAPVLLVGVLRYPAPASVEVYCVHLRRPQHGNVYFEPVETLQQTLSRLPDACRAS